MTIGDKIKHLRKEKGFSQEQLAQELFVSRAAVAKWEAGNGIPDIENLKKLSGVFEISIDELLDNHLPEKNDITVDNPICEQNEACPSLTETISDYYHQFIGKKCDLELCDWNDGVNDVWVVGVDEGFVYYLKEVGKEHKKNFKSILGALNKKYIDSVKLIQTKRAKEGKEALLKDKMDCIISDTVFKGENSKAFFVGKTADVYLEDKHIWSGILTKSTELFDVGIKAFDGEKLVLVTDREIEIKDISKIEVKHDFI